MISSGSSAPVSGIEALGGAASNQRSFLDKPLPKPTEVNEAAYALLFSEIVRYSYRNVAQISDLEAKLSKLGYDVGWRMLELVASREKGEIKRELRIVNALRHVTGPCWTAIFGKPADALERSSSGPKAYLIREKDPLPCRYASIPADLGQLNLAYFNAGIVRGLLVGQGYTCTVSAHADPANPSTVVYLVEFDDQVLEREARLIKAQG